jgi:hypothetical protein
MRRKSSQVLLNMLSVIGCPVVVDIKTSMNFYVSVAIAFPQTKVGRGAVSEYATMNDRIFDQHHMRGGSPIAVPSSALHMLSYKKYHHGKSAQNTFATN